jgi:hypothetical protein
MLFYLPRCRCPLDPGLHRRDHPAQQADRLTLAQAQPGRQTLPVLACMRKGDTFAALAAGSAFGTATAWRYVSKTVALLAARRARGEHPDACHIRARVNRNATTLDKSLKYE